MKKESRYVLLPPKPVILFEVLLPKRKKYEKKLRQVLDAFVKPDAVGTIPDVATIVAIRSRLEETFRKKEFLSHISEVISGYSIYEVDGRFRGDDGQPPVDERTWVIRFIIHDPKLEGAIRPELVEMSKEVICHLVTKRFAEEIGSEDEIWFVEYQGCILQRWIMRTKL